MTKGDRQAYGLSGVGLGATAVALVVPQLWPHVPWYLWQAILWVGLVLIGVAVTTLLSLHLSRRQWAYCIFGVLLLAIASAAWYCETLPDTTPLSLAEIYITDQFAGMVLPVREDININADNAVLLAHFIATKYYNFNANAYYFSLYMPHSKYTFDICAYVARTFQNSILHQFSWLEAGSRVPGDSAAMSQSEMIFTGRVYLYVKDDLTPEQIGELHSIYKQNHLYMEFRGVEYLSHHWSEYERRNSNDLKQFRQQPNHENL
jgi:hypothetical protein